MICHSFLDSSENVEVIVTDSGCFSVFFLTNTIIRQFENKHYNSINAYLLRRSSVLGVK
jgi:hypothetical protein